MLRGQRAATGALSRAAADALLGGRHAASAQRLQDRAGPARHRPRAAARPRRARRSPRPTSASSREAAMPPSNARTHVGTPAQPRRRPGQGDRRRPLRRRVHRARSGCTATSSPAPSPRAASPRIDTDGRARRARRGRGLHPREPAAHGLVRLKLPGRGGAARLAVPAALRRQDRLQRPADGTGGGRELRDGAPRGLPGRASNTRRSRTRPTSRPARTEAYVPPKKRSRHQSAAEAARRCRRGA